MVPNDPFINYQNHLWQVGDIEAVWDDYSGKGVAIGIYDTGVDAQHPDLMNNYDASLHYDGAFGADDPTDDLRSAGSAHGTSVAGVIAASANNDLGIAGMAFDAKITGVSYISHEYSSRLERVSLTEHGRVFDVVNFSVNYNNAALYYTEDHNIFARYSENETYPSIGASHLQAFQHLASEGRDGRGTIIVKAVGNLTESSTTPHPDGNSAGDSLNTPYESIVVSGLDHFGEADAGIRNGANVLVAAPMALFTTDVAGDGGAVGEDTAGSFGADYTFGMTRGSSFAAPVVSGTVALMLEANPNLGWRDVQHILAASAQGAGQLVDNAHGHSWREAEQGHFNGGGYLTHNSFGYGRVDAHAAVRMAEAWAVMQPEAKTSANLTQITATADGAESFDSQGLEIALDVSHNLDVEYVYINFKLDHGDLSDLTLSLVAPDGTRFELLEGYSYSRPVDDELTFGLAHARGLNAAGQWQVEVKNSGELLGQISDLNLRFQGDQSDMADDVHHITDAIWHLTDPSRQSAGEAEATRLLLRDDDGGTDWLNLSAFTGQAMVDLRSTEITLSGQWDGLPVARQLRLAEAEMVEHIYGGTGADRLNGSQRAETIIGGQGDDVLMGRGGADQLIGGEGHDRASYADAADRIAINLLGGQNEGDAAGDILESIEAMEGSAYDDDIRGSHRRDVLLGGEGNDWMMGQNGRDLLLGGAGNDVLLGGKHADELRGGAGNDRLVGGEGDDRLVDMEGDNIYVGGAGNDDITDGAGDAVIHAGQGNDTVNGHAGNDHIQGGAGEDVLSGSHGADTLFGESGNDILIGDDGTAPDHAGDVFVFAPGMGEDRILDFDASEGDTLRIDAGLLGDWPDAVALISNQAEQFQDHVMIQFAPGHSLRLDGVSDLEALLPAIEIA